jgi:hypothetical protein
MAPAAHFVFNEVSQRLVEGWSGGAWIAFAQKRLDFSPAVPSGD